MPKSISRETGRQAGRQICDDGFLQFFIYHFILSGVRSQNGVGCLCPQHIILYNTYYTIQLYSTYYTMHTIVYNYTMHTIHVYNYTIHTVQLYNTYYTTILYTLYNTHYTTIQYILYNKQYPIQLYSTYYTIQLRPLSVLGPDFAFPLQSSFTCQTSACFHGQH